MIRFVGNYISELSGLETGMRFRHYMILNIVAMYYVASAIVAAVYGYTQWAPEGSDGLMNLIFPGLIIVTSLGPLIRRYIR